jgi:cation transport protein ChaC
MKRWPNVPSTLCRSDLEQGRMREIYAATVNPDLALDDEQLSASLMATLAEKPKSAGWWVFAYGSLLWNPLFPVAEMRPATLRGSHRRFCLWSLASRGTTDCPGLVLGLERGGTCRGVVLRLPAPLALDELHLLWRREMVVGSYQPRWVKVDADGRDIVALTFVVRRDHPQYAGKLPLERQVNVLARATGAFGASADYLERTRVALVSHGIVDPYLEGLAAAVVAQRATRPE